MGLGSSGPQGLAVGRGSMVQRRARRALKGSVRDSFSEFTASKFLAS
jgi:hypothetical protein